MSAAESPSTLGGDPTAVRLLWAVLTIFPGAILCGVLAYIAAWIIMPLAQPTVAHPAGRTGASVGPHP